MTSHIPDPPRTSYWEAEPELRALVARLLPAASFDFLRPRLERMGKIAAEELAELAHVADHEGPRLVPRTPLGERIDRVVYHPAYHRMEEIAYGSGLVAMKYDPAVRREHALLQAGEGPGFDDVSGDRAGEGYGHQGPLLRRQSEDEP